MLCCIVLYIHEIFFNRHVTCFQCHSLYAYRFSAPGWPDVVRKEDAGRQNENGWLSNDPWNQGGSSPVVLIGWCWIDSGKRLRKNFGINHYASNGKNYKTHDFDSVIVDSKLLVITRGYPHLLSIFDWIFHLKHPETIQLLVTHIDHILT